MEYVWQGSKEITSDAAEEKIKHIKYRPATRNGITESIILQPRDTIDIVRITESEIRLILKNMAG